jgi:hypothetical protein
MAGNSDLHQKLQWKPPVLNFKKYVQCFMGYIYRPGTLWITVAEIWHCRTSLSESLQCLKLEICQWFSCWYWVAVKRDTHELRRRYPFFSFTLSVMPKSDVGRCVLTCYLNAAKKCNIGTDNKSLKITKLKCNNNWNLYFGYSRKVCVVCVTI